MKATKIVGFLIVISVLGAGLYLYQKNKQNKELAAYNKQKFQQMTEAAEKSSSAGLLVMASSINKYYKIKGHYPKELINLYPEFIPDKSFILTLNWKYYPGNGTFSVKKNVTGKQIFSSMGPDMRLITESGQTKASFGKVVSAVSSKASKKPAVLIVSKTEAGSKKDTKKDSIATVLLPKEIKKPGKVESSESKVDSKIKPEVAIVKKELNSNEKFLLSFDRYNLYIWKTREGIIGFSNIQYPEEEKLTIYKNNSWIEYHNPNSSDQK